MTITRTESAPAELDQGQLFAVNPEDGTFELPELPGATVGLDQRVEHLTVALEALNFANGRHGFIMAATNKSRPRYRELRADYGDTLPFEVDRALNERKKHEKIAEASIDKLIGRSALLEAGFEPEEVDEMATKMHEDFIDAYGVGRAKAPKRNAVAHNLVKSQKEIAEQTQHDNDD